MSLASALAKISVGNGPCPRPFDEQPSDGPPFYLQSS